MGISEEKAFDDLAGFAIEAIRSAGQEALPYYGKGSPELKFDEELVTEVELRLSEFFQNRLNAQFPEHQIFLNNHENLQYTHENSRYLWVFDALDGVANFQAGIPVWGMSLALLENFWPVFGAFFMPATGDIFHAQAGQEAFWGEKRIKTGDSAEINDESVLLTYARFHNHYSCNFPGKVRSLGCTAAHICYVAAGRAEAAVLAGETYQNLAATRVITEAAGIKLYRMDGSEFFLNEYLDGSKIGETLLAVSPDNLQNIQDCLKPASL